MEIIMTTGKIDDRKCRNKPRGIMPDRLRRLYGGISIQVLIQHSRSRELGRVMALRHLARQMLTIILVYIQLSALADLSLLLEPKSCIYITEGIKEATSRVKF